MSIQSHNMINQDLQGKLIKKVIAIVLIVVLCISAICFLYKPIYYRLYLGDRIKGTISVVVDGQIYQLQPKEIQGTTELEISEDSSKAELSIHAGEYGGYPIYVYLDTADIEMQSIRINCFQANWWNVTEFEAYIEIDTSKNCISFNGDCVTLDEDGKKIHDKIDKQQSLDDEYLGISFGL